MIHKIFHLFYFGGIGFVFTEILSDTGLTGGWHFFAYTIFILPLLIIGSIHLVLGLEKHDGGWEEAPESPPNTRAYKKIMRNDKRIDMSKQLHFVEIWDGVGKRGD